MKRSIQIPAAAALWAACASAVFSPHASRSSESFRESDDEAAPEA